MGHGGNLELKREAKSKTSFTDQTSAVSHFWIESEDQLGVKDDLMSLIFAQYLQNLRISFSLRSNIIKPIFFYCS